MDHLDILRRSIALTDAVLAAGPISSEATTAPTACSEFDLAALGDHIIGTHEFLTTAAGGTVDTSGDTLAEQHRNVGPDVVAAWEARGVEGTIDLGGNDLPAGFGLTLHALESFVHAWDLADALDRAFEPEPDLIEAAWDAARAVVSDDARSTEPGAPYGPALDAGADPLLELIAFCGREPVRP